MIFSPGVYYVGDPGYVLPSEDLRCLFFDLMQGSFVSGPRNLLVSKDYQKNFLDQCWIVAIPNKQGTFYDQNNKGWGFDWGVFGVVPWKWVDPKACYDNHKITFTEEFKCSFVENNISIGNFYFTLNLK